MMCRDAAALGHPWPSRHLCLLHVAIQRRLRGDPQGCGEVGQRMEQLPGARGVRG